MKNVVSRIWFGRLVSVLSATSIWPNQVNEWTKKNICRFDDMLPCCCCLFLLNISSANIIFLLSVVLSMIFRPHDLFIFFFIWFFCFIHIFVNLHISFRFDFCFFFFDKKWQWIYSQNLAKSLSFHQIWNDFIALVSLCFWLFSVDESWKEATIEFIFSGWFLRREKN